MKKLFLNLAVVFTMGFLMSAKVPINNEEIVAGRACVNTAMEFVHAAVDAGIGDGELNGTDHDEYMTIYHFYYRECMLGNV